jgi:hypothetical protein
MLGVELRYITPKAEESELKTHVLVCVIKTPCKRGTAKLTEDSRLGTPQLAVFGANLRWGRGHGRQNSTRRRSVTSSFGPVGCQSTWSARRVLRTYVPYSPFRILLQICRAKFARLCALSAEKVGGARSLVTDPQSPVRGGEGGGWESAASIMNLLAGFTSFFALTIMIIAVRK